MAMLALACSSGPCAGDGHDEETVRGLVLEVNARSVLELDSLRLRDESGRAWLFHGDGGTFPEFSPSHVRDHMVGGLPLSVTFEARYKTPLPPSGEGWSLPRDSIRGWGCPTIGPTLF